MGRLHAGAAGAGMSERSRGRRRLLLAVALLVAALAAAWLAWRDELRGWRARARFPPVVVVTHDTLHVDITGPYNPAVETTPTLDRFAETGITFDHAYTTVPITLPAHTSLFSGRLPPDLGVMVNGDVVDDAVETLAELLSRHGYRTGAVTSLGVLNTPANLSQGFDHYDDEVGGRWERWYRTADEVVAAARGWVEQVAGEPFFLWLHLSDPHEPYLPKDAPPDVRLLLDGEPHSEWTLTTKERYRTALDLPPGRHTLTWQPLREPRPDDKPATSLVLELVELDSPELDELPAGPEEELFLYQERYSLEVDNPHDRPVPLAVTFRGRTNTPPASEVYEHYPVEIAFMDHHLGEFERFMAERGLAEETLWVVVSDHGEGLYRYGSIGHATYTQEDQLRIVWMLRGPGLPAGRRVSDQPVVVEDVLPTLLELLGLPVPRASTGHSQTGCWSGDGCVGREEWWAYGADVEREEVVALAGYRWPFKLLWQNRRRTGGFEVASDPWEADELSGLEADDRDRGPRELARLAASLERHRRGLQKRLEERGAAELTPEQEEMLRGLGYIN